MKHLQRVFLALLIVSFVLVMMSCGGGGGSTTGGGTPPVQPPETPTPITVATTSLPDAVEDTPYSAQFVASGGKGALTYTLQMQSSNYGGTAWASIDSSGKITGTPTYNDQGTPIIRITVHDTAAQVTYAEFRIRVDTRLQAGESQIGSGTRGVPYYGLTYVWAGRPPYSLTSTSGLPPGVTATISNSLITVAGTPTAAGEYDVKFVASDSVTPPQSVTISAHISLDSRFRIVPKTFPASKQGQPFVGQLEVVNGTPPYTISAPTLSSIGLSVDATGKITGVIIDPYGGGYQFNIPFTVTDAANQMDTRWQGFLTYRPLSLVPPRDPVVLHVGESVGQYFGAYGGIWPYKFSMQFGQLPPGLRIDETNHTFQGTPTTTGSYAFGIHVADSNTPPDAADASYRFEVLGPALIAPGGELPKASQNRTYTTPMQIDGGTPPYQWTFLQGDLPQGLSLTSDGVVSGTPTTLGRYSFETMVEDSSVPVQSIRNFYSVRVVEAPKRRNDTLLTASVLNCCIDASLSPYADPVDTINPDTDYYFYKAKAGSTVNVQTSKYYFSRTDTVIEILDSNGHRFQTCRNLEDDTSYQGIQPDLTPNSYDDECLNDDYVLGDNSGSGLQFLVPSTGPATVDFYVHVLDFSGTARPDFGYQLTVNGAASLLTLTANPFQAYVGSPYSTALDIGSGGSTVTPPYKFSLVPGSGELPPGLNLPASDPTGYSYPYISGTPTASGHYTFKVQVADSAATPATGTGTVTIDVADAPRLQFDPLPDATTGQVYDVPYTLTGGTGNRYVEISGSWPNGLTWANGHIHGTPTEDGSFTGIVIPVADFKAGARVTYTLVVKPGPLVVQGVPPAKLGQVFDAWLTATGGRTTPYQKYTWTLLSGTLPPGMTLNADWLHGIPTQAGTFNFDVQVSDASVPAQSATARMTVIVQP